MRVDQIFLCLIPAVVAQSTGQIKLVNGTNQCSGRVEVFYQGKWGTVCDDLWDLNDAKVVCRQLGCEYAVSTLDKAHFGQGTGPIWMSSVQCSGNEDKITQCPFLSPAQCKHSEDAGVVCSGFTTAATTTTTTGKPTTTKSSASAGMFMPWTLTCFFVPLSMFYLL